MAQLPVLPDFDSLPPVPGMPQGCAWGLFDKDGKKDHLGCLNLLTPEVVKDAYAEAYSGVSISLNWSLASLKEPFFGRQGVEHRVISYHSGPKGVGLHSYDDEVAFNTQCSSQWDSFVHFAHQSTGLNYNGIAPRSDDLVQPFGSFDVEKTIPTLNHWHERGGLVGRGVLLDYCAYAQAKNIQYNCFDNHAVTIQDLEGIIEHQGVNLKQGDIIIVRTGFTDALDAVDGEEQTKLLAPGRVVGVEGNLETAKWFWNHHPAAVAGDNMAFEAMPPRRPDGTDGTNAELGTYTSWTDTIGYIGH